MTASGGCWLLVVVKSEGESETKKSLASLIKSKTQAKPRWTVDQVVGSRQSCSSRRARRRGRQVGDESEEITSVEAGLQS
jgi:hypothetical protein